MEKTTSKLGPILSTANPAANEHTADAAEYRAKELAATVALSPFSSNIDAWWKIRAVLTRLGVLRAMASSQKLGDR